MNALNPTTMNILRGMTFDGNKAFLNQPQLPRPVYEDVNEVLIRLRGKWKGGRTQAHIFPYDPQPLVEAVIESKEMPPKNPTAFFATQPDVIEEMVDFADASYLNNWPEARILEPSAGTGAIADEIGRKWPLAKVDLVEIERVNCQLLRAKGYNPHTMDFLQFKPAYQYDLVLMNPPFALNEDPLAYISHIEHAFALMRNGGVLVSVVPAGFLYRSDNRHDEFRKLVCDYGEWFDLPDDAFKKSGTGVSTMLIRLEKQDIVWKRKPYNGWKSWYVWVTFLWIDNNGGSRLQDEAYALADRLRRKGQVDLFGYPSAEGRKAIDELVDRVVKRANRTGEGIYLSEDDRVEIYQSFMDQYGE